MRSRMLAPIALLLSLLVTALLGLPAPSAPQATGAIAGIVRDEAGRGVPSATVRIRFGPAVGSARTDANGLYQLTELPAGVYEVGAQKPAYNPHYRSEVSVVANLTTTIDFKITWGNSGAGAVEVLAQTRSGQPLPDATVDLTSNNFLVGRLPTDEIGSAVFPGLTPGLYSIEVRRPGFATAFTRNFRVRATVMTTLATRLIRDTSQAGRIAGVIRNEQRQPVQGATVSITEGLTQARARTGVDGRYEFSGLVPAANYALEVSARGFATQTLSRVPVDVGALTVRDFTLLENISQRGSISGYVRNGAGGALPFVSVTLTAGPDAGREVQTDSDGLYVLDDLEPAGNYAVLAEQPGYSPVGRYGLVVKRGQTTVVNLEMRTQQEVPGSISGTVTDAGSGQFLSNVLVEVIRGASAGLTATTDGSGHYVLAGLVPDDSYTLRFTRNGYEVQSASQVRVRSGTRTDVDAELTERNASVGHITGFVRKSGGGILADAKVSLYEGPSAPLQTTTDRYGAFSFRNLRAGNGYGLRVERAGFLTVTRRSLEVRSGQALQADFTLRRGDGVGSVVGRVLNLNQQPIVGARIRVLTGPQFPPEALTDANGEFVMEGVGPGTYTLEAAANGYRSREATTTVVARGTSRLTFLLLPP